MLTKFCRWIGTPGTYREDYLFGKSLARYRATYFWRVDDWGNAYIKELPILKKNKEVLCMIKNRYWLSMNERLLMFERLKNYKGTTFAYVVEEGERTYIHTIPFFESVRRYYV